MLSLLSIYKSLVIGYNGTATKNNFILFPNVKLLMVKTIDLNFADSDHNTVYMKAALKQ